MKNLFTIGEMSKIFDINAKALRYYSEIGLFEPIFVDERNNYRYYSIEQFEQLNTIRYLRALGIPLETIRYNLKNRSIGNIIELFEKQRKVTEEKINELERIKGRLDSRIDQLNYAKNYSYMEIVQEIQFDNRKIALLKSKIKTSQDLEMSIKNLENRSNNKDNVFHGKVGVGMNIERLRTRNFEEYDYIFLLVEGEKYGEEFLKELPKGKYLCIRFNGTHEDATVYYDKIIDYAKENKYEIIDDAIEIPLIDFGITTNTEEFVTEIQVLVR